MKKIIGVLLFGLLASCVRSDLSQEVKVCKYPDAPEIDAPLWVCGAKIDGILVSGVGIANKSKAGVNFMLQQASANARVVLAQQVNSDVNSAIKNYMKTQGVGEDEVLDSQAEIFFNVVTKQMLNGTRVIKQNTSPNGTLYVVVGFDDSKIYDKLLKQAMDSSYNHNQAQWNNALKDSSFDSLKDGVVEKLVNQAE